MISNILRMRILLKYQEKLRYDNCLYFCYLLIKCFIKCLSLIMHKKESVSYKPLHLHMFVRNSLSYLKLLFIRLQKILTVDVNLEISSNNFTTRVPLNRLNHHLQTLLSSSTFLVLRKHIHTYTDPQVK